MTAEYLHPSGGGAAESVGAKRARAVAATPSAASGTACEKTAKSAHIGAGDVMRETSRRSPSGTPRPAAAPNRADTWMETRQ